MNDTEHAAGAEGALTLEAFLPEDRVLDGKYELRGILGEGGMGVVYDATRKSDGARVALKVMHRHLAGDKQIRGRFRREAAILRRLEGAHICPILELGEVSAPGTSDDKGGSILYMALPKLDGASLEDVLRTEGPLEVGRAVDVMLEVCAALRVAHAHGVIHRDLKPANVILEKGKTAVVVDFGMSKIVHGDESTGLGTTNLTAHNMMFGTPEYMSPEQARGDELDARCDVYAAGVMFYEMLAGKRPFTGATPLNVLTEHLTGVLVPPSKVAPERLTPALESAALHALARDREQRYASAAAFAAAIMHARAAPEDVTSLRPGAFATSPEGTDAFAPTMPEVVTKDGAPSRAEPSEATADTILAGAAEASSRLTSDPPTQPSARLPSVPPRDSGTGPRSHPKGRSSSPPRLGPASSAPLDDVSGRTWILLWVLAGILSIALGVYLALR